MDFFYDPTTFLLLIVGFCALGSLMSTKPSISARWLFVESIAINLLVAVSLELTSPGFGTSILLSIFMLIAVAITIYFESSFNPTVTKTPKINIFSGIILMFIFFYYLQPNITNYLIDKELELPFLEKDIFTLTVTSFSLFCILIASTIIFDAKNSRYGGTK